MLRAKRVARVGVVCMMDSFNRTEGWQAERTASRLRSVSSAGVGFAACPARARGPGRGIGRAGFGRRAGALLPRPSRVRVRLAVEVVKLLAGEGQRVDLCAILLVVVVAQPANDVDVRAFAQVLGGVDCLGTPQRPLDRGRFLGAVVAGPVERVEKSPGR